jgi:hypothetical protein
MEKERYYISELYVVQKKHDVLELLQDIRLRILMVRILCLGR